MNGPSALSRSARTLRAPRATTTTTTTTTRYAYVCWQCRGIQISAVPSTDSPSINGDAFGGVSRDASDARFEVIGSPYSLLSVSLSASQRLYTRRGTLVAVAGDPENAQSTLSVLNPLARAPLGVPFLYQRISATSPITALIATRSPTTTFAILRLDGRTDWMLAQRGALLAWTGHTLKLTPRIQRGLALAHWGSTEIMGRGLVALSAPGSVYRLELAEGEEFVARPGSVVAYSVGREMPRAFRFKSSNFSLRVQVPGVVGRLVPDVEWVKRIRGTGVYKWFVGVMYAVRTMMRRTVWGDRLFLRFTGPVTVLMSSRGVRVGESLTEGQVNEIADAPAGVVEAALRKVYVSEGAASTSTGHGKGGEVEVVARKGSHGGKYGEVSFEDVKQLKETL